MLYDIPLTAVSCALRTFPPPQIATRYYLPALRNKALTAKLHPPVQDAFVSRFGPYAGW